MTDKRTDIGKNDFNMTYFYFSIMRPISIGTYPGRPIWWNNFDKRIKVPCINHEAWGVLEYDHQLTDKEVYGYELMRADLAWASDKLVSGNDGSVYGVKRK